MANDTELRRMTVDELRRLAREKHVSGVSGMRKDDLVKALTTAAGKPARGTSAKKASGSAKASDRPKASGSAKASDSGGVRTGPGTSRSLRYAQEITSPDDEPERAGRSLVTTDHEVIRRWAEERDAQPATVEGSEHDGHPGVLRFDFPGGSGGSRLVHVSWDDWFAAFDERRLNFIYQETRSDGRQSNFFRLENPDREDA